MRKLLVIRLLLLSMWVLLTAGSVYAQSRIQVEIPFPFTVADKLFPADTYTAVRLPPASPNVIQVRSPDLSTQAILIMNCLEARPNQEVKPKFVFRRYGDQYFLAQVWMGGALGRETRKSNKERQITRLTSEPEWIYLAAK